MLTNRYLLCCNSTSSHLPHLPSSRTSLWSFELSAFCWHNHYTPRLSELFVTPVSQCFECNSQCLVWMVWNYILNLLYVTEEVPTQNRIKRYYFLLVSGHIHSKYVKMVQWKGSLLFELVLLDDCCEIRRTAPM